MRIAFDAKRVYENGTGLGHYSRTLVASLASLYPEHDYFLCTPRITHRFSVAKFSNVTNVCPQTLISKAIKSAWRSSWVKADLQKLDIDLYHGLSNEVPLGIERSGMKSVVTIHDLIFERYPAQYKKVDVQIYRKKFRHACQKADRIIAISQQTKDDIMQFYHVPESKIDICYQSCDPAFTQTITDDEKLRVKNLYSLPEQFYLYVGSIIERKNLLNICRAIKGLKQDGTAFPLVVIGKGDHYEKQVKQYVKDAGISDLIIFLSDNKIAKKHYDFITAKDFPAIFQQAIALVYPSVFEGFGIPVLEGLWSKIPVITSNVSCLPETGGDAAYYVNPVSVEHIAFALNEVATNQDLRSGMISRGLRHAEKFTPEKCAAKVMQVYLSLK